MIWKPHVTVAAVIEQAGKFLLVEENTSDGVLFNQPAGHLDAGESIIAAVIRETLEETAYHFVPESLIGIYQWHQPAHDRTYLRFAFAGRITGHEPGRALDAGIIRAVWQAPEDIRASRQRHRSPLVSDCVDDYLGGVRYPLTLLRHYG
ncbi:NUDIX hydrolase [Sulfuriferula sp. AH1]|uniref:NUDIX hydrolase n=1 Tax=Sulfuriferula sp. AH1 TaxID=1985873 RepID=UPI000B3B592A|nr:NUDIX hydrolase [Sulfuriferula sp. AH1]ARU32117.1 NUDIX hydrolase [Sulfuriferula sp. AH1]